MILHAVAVHAFLTFAIMFWCWQRHLNEVSSQIHMYTDLVGHLSLNLFHTIAAHSLFCSSLVPPLPFSTFYLFWLLLNLSFSSLAYSFVHSFLTPLPRLPALSCSFLLSYLHLSLSCSLSRLTHSASLCLCSSFPPCLGCVLDFLLVHIAFNSNINKEMHYLIFISTSFWIYNTHSNCENICLCNNFWCVYYIFSCFAHMFQYFMAP